MLNNFQFKKNYESLAKSARIKSKEDNKKNVLDDIPSHIKPLKKIKKGGKFVIIDSGSESILHNFLMCVNKENRF